MVNILARILDSERNFNGSADPMITADRGFLEFWGPDFGFWLLGSSSLPFFLVSARFCFDTDVGYINISLIVILHAKTQSRKATPTTEVTLYLTYHLTRQTICGFGFS